MTWDLLVRGDDEDVAIHDGVVAEVGPELEGAAREELDARDLVVLPGVVDAHVHLNDPGRANWEGFATGTRACAAGGTTCAVDMPLNALPPTLDGASFDEKAAATRGRLHCDVALWGGLVGDGGSLDRLEELAARGVVGFKAFLSDAGVPEFPSVDVDRLHAGMARAAALGLPVAVHAEDDRTTRELTAAARARGDRSVAAYLATRPIAAEVTAIEAAIAAARDTGCALHVVHVSSAAGLEKITEAWADGVDVTGELCPHHLTLTADDAEALGAVAKCAPPLRSPDEVVQLRAALGDAWSLGSDHSPAPAELKQGDDALAWWGGISGAQTLLAVTWPTLRALGFEAHDAARMLAGAPAGRCGLKRKGRLEVGADADLVLWDPHGTWTVSQETLHDRHRLSPWRGRTLEGRHVRTLLRGRTIAEHGTPVGPPTGRLLQRG